MLDAVETIEDPHSDGADEYEDRNERHPLGLDARRVVDESSALGAFLLLREMPVRVPVVRDPVQRVVDDDIKDRVHDIRDRGNQELVFRPDPVPDQHDWDLRERDREESRCKDVEVDVDDPLALIELERALGHWSGPQCERLMTASAIK